jgi:hypothetical protein
MRESNLLKDMTIDQALELFPECEIAEGGTRIPPDSKLRIAAIRLYGDDSAGCMTGIRKDVYRRMALELVDLAKLHGKSLAEARANLANVTIKQTQ